MKCEVVQDLLPIYEDDLCDEVTKKEIENHLVACNECKKQLEEYRKEITLNRAEKEDLDKVDLFKKTRKKQRRLVIISILLAVIIGFVGFSIWFESEYCQYFNINYINVYLRSKKQNELLINGKIDEFVDNIYFKDYDIRVDGKKDTVNIKKYYKKEIINYYNKFIKNKDIEIERMNIYNSPLHEGFTDIGSSDSTLKVKGEEDITIIYEWVGDKCIPIFYEDSNLHNDYSKTVNEKLNVFYDKDGTSHIKYMVNKQFNKSLSLGFYSLDFNTKEHKDLVKRIKEINKLSDTQVFCISNKKYYEKDKAFKCDLRLAVKGKKTGKIAVLEQTLVESYVCYLPVDDAKIISNNGISKELEEKLLKLF